MLFRVPGQGWANRLRTFASAYLLAVLSGRLFLVDWSYPRRWDVLLSAPFAWDWSLAGLDSQHADVLDAVAINSKGARRIGVASRRTPNEARRVARRSVRQRPARPAHQQAADLVGVGV